MLNNTALETTGFEKSVETTNYAQDDASARRESCANGPHASAVSCPPPGNRDGSSRGATHGGQDREALVVVPGGGPLERRNSRG